MNKWSVFVILLAFVCCVAVTTLSSWSNRTRDEPAWNKINAIGKSISRAIVYKNFTALGTLRFRADSMIRQADFSDCGKFIRTLQTNGKLHTWSVKTGKIVRSLKWELPPANMIAMSKDKKYLAVVHKNTIEVFDYTSKKSKWKKSTLFQIQCVAFHPSQPIVAYDSSHGLTIRRAESGKTIKQIASRRFSGPHEICFSRSGKWLALAGSHGKSGAIQLFDVKEMRPIRMLTKHVGYVQAMRFGAEDQTLFSVSHDGSVLQSACPSLRSIKRYKIQMIDASSDCCLFVSAKNERVLVGISNLRNLKIVDGKTGKRTNGGIGHVSVSTVAAPKKRWQLYSGDGDGNIILWNLKTKKPIRRYCPFPKSQTGVRALEITPNCENLIALGNDSKRGRVAILDLRTDKWIGRIERKRVFANWNMVVDGKSMLLVQDNGTVERVTYPTLETVSTLNLRKKWVTLGVVSSANSLLVYGEPLRPIYVRNHGTNRQYFVIPNVKINIAKFSSDGRLLAALGPDSVIEISETATGARIARFPGQDKESYTCLFSRSGRFLFTGGEDKNIHVWDLAFGKKVTVLHGHIGSVGELAMSHDESVLFSAGSDPRILLWNLKKILPRPEPKKPLTKKKIDYYWGELITLPIHTANVNKAKWRLIFSPDSVVPFIAKELPTPPKTTLRDLKKLIAQLDDKRFRQRATSRRAIWKMGPPITNLLTSELKKTKSAQVKASLQTLLNDLSKPMVSKYHLKYSRGIEILERIGNKHAKQVLKRLADGPECSFITIDARQSLKRIAE